MTRAPSNDNTYANMMHLLLFPALCLLAHPERRQLLFELEGQGLQGVVAGDPQHRSRPYPLPLKHAQGCGRARPQPGMGAFASLNPASCYSITTTLRAGNWDTPVCRAGLRLKSATRQAVLLPGIELLLAIGRTLGDLIRQCYRARGSRTSPTSMRATRGSCSPSIRKAKALMGAPTSSSRSVKGCSPRLTHAPGGWPGARHHGAVPPPRRSLYTRLPAHRRRSAW